MLQVAAICTVGYGLCCAALRYRFRGGNIFSWSAVVVSAFLSALAFIGDKALIPFLPFHAGLVALLSCLLFNELGFYSYSRRHGELPFAQQMLFRLLLQGVELGIPFLIDTRNLPD